jgi:DNA-binding NarL/FixJ family response regulator
MKIVQILIADDHELVQKGLRAVLENQPGWKVCGEAVNGR